MTSAPNRLLALGATLLLAGVPPTSVIYAGDAAKLVSARLGTLEGEEQVRFIAAHNAARKAVGVDPLRWSAELAAYARESLEAQKADLIRAAQEGFAERRLALPKHRSESEYGENIAGWMGARSRHAESAVAFWLEEKADFDALNLMGSYRVGDETGKTERDREGRERPVIVGHYTQIVWRTTTHLGAASLEFELVGDRGESRTYAAIICNYDPPGNRQGGKPY
jgi:pathogenesis-related protein 1